MHARVFQHVPFEGLGSIGAWLAARDARVSWTRWHEPGADDPGPELPDLLIVLGGPMSANDDETLPWLAAERAGIRRAIDAGIPTLGICLGAQQIARAAGAAVYRNPEREIGWWPVRPAGPGNGRFAHLFADQIDAFHWHGETFDLPPDADHLAASDACANQAFSLGDHVLALQFHLETTPAAAAALAEHCDDHRSPGRRVQSEAAMLADPRRFASANRLMNAVLDRLTGPRGR